MEVLAGDVGGTNTRLALFAVDGDRLRPGPSATFPSRRHAGLAEIVREFSAGAGGGCQRAGFGVAGPVRNGRCLTTNLPWVVDAAELARETGLERVDLLNDLEAMAWGLELVSPDRVRVLQEGRPDPRGNAALIAAGTGLGEAGLAWDARRRRPFASEGGHADFAPGDELEAALWRDLAGRHEHVSWERVVSGPGLVHLHDFLCRNRGAPAPAWLAGEMAAGDPAAAVAGAALSGRCATCDEALGRFVHLYGAEAGNLALKVMATAGVWVAGSIAAKILPRLERGGFLEAFRAKGRMRPLLEAMPVAVVLDDRAPLLGAARVAAGLVDGGG